MAYLNCAFCPAQAFPVPTDPFIEFGQGITKLKCISKHTTYVDTRDINGEQRQELSDNVPK